MLLFYDESKGASDKYPSSSVKISHTYLIWVYLLYSIHATQIEIFKNQISMSKILLLSAIYLLLSFMQFLVCFLQNFHCNSGIRERPLAHSYFRRTWIKSREDLVMCHTCEITCGLPRFINSS